MLQIGNLLIIGDSYSTFDGYIPQTNLTWYPGNDVQEVSMTWWWQFIKETNASLLLNESFSGSTVCNTERPTIPHTSFIYRLENLIDDGFFEKNRVDTIILFGGTNDSWIDAPIGENQYENFTEESLKEVLPAFCYLVKRLQAVTPSAQIIVVLNCDINPLITQGFSKACQHFKIPCAHLENVGKENGHPNQVGMTAIKDQIIQALEK